MTQPDPIPMSLKRIPLFAAAIVAILATTTLGLPSLFNTDPYSARALPARGPHGGHSLTNLMMA